MENNTTAESLTPELKALLEKYFGKPRKPRRKKPLDFSSAWRSPYLIVTDSKGISRIAGWLPKKWGA